MIGLEAARELYDLMQREAAQSTSPHGLFDFMRNRFPGNGTDSPISLDWVARGGKVGPGRDDLPENHKVLLKPPTDQVLLASLHFACHVVQKFKREDGVYIPELDDSIRSVDRLMVFWWKKGGIKGVPLQGYDILAESEDELMKLLQKDGRAAKEISARLATNVLAGVPMSSRLRVLVWALLTGEIVPPPVPKREPTEKQRDTLLVAIADSIRTRTYFSASANQTKFARGEAVPICGCTIAAAALKAFGIHIDPLRASKIYNQKKHLPLGQLDLRLFLRVPMQNEQTILGAGQPDLAPTVMNALGYFA